MKQIQQSDTMPKHFHNPIDNRRNRRDRYQYMIYNY